MELLKSTEVLDSCGFPCCPGVAEGLERLEKKTDSSACREEYKERTVAIHFTERTL